MPVVTVPNYGDVEFPDSMSDDEILAVLRKSNFTAEPQDLHSRGAQVAHIMAKGLPMAGGIAGGIVGGGMGAVGGAPSGPGALLTSALGASAGAGLLSSAGRAAQHFVDERLGYEQTGDFVNKLKDVAATGAKDAAYTMAGGLALGSAAEGARMLPGALDSVGTRLGRRVLTGGTHQLGARQPVSPAAINDAYEAGAFRPFGTTQNAANTLDTAKEAAGSKVGNLLTELKSRGVTGSNAQSLARQWIQDAKAIEARSLMSPEPQLLRGAADEVAGKPVDVRGNLALDVQEEMKRSLQFQASKQYDKISRQYTPLGEAQKALAARMRQATEDAIAAQAGQAPAEAAAFIPAKEKFANLAEAASAAEEGAARAARRGHFSLYDVLAAGAGLHHSPLQAAALGLGSKAVRTFGPSTATWAAKGLSNVTEPLAAIPDVVPALSSRVGAALGPAQLSDMSQVRALIEALRQRSASPAALAQNQTQ